jgi:hypothetical protein
VRRAPCEQFGKQHHALHLAQVAGAAGASLEADDAFDRRHEAKAPGAKRRFQIDQFFRQFIQRPIPVAMLVRQIALYSGGVIATSGARYSP